MLYLAAWVLALAVLYIVFNHEVEQRYNPNQSPRTYTDNGVPTVVLERNQQGHYLVNGHINAFPTTFMVDTGATNVSVPLKLAEKIGLRKGGQAWVQTAGGRAIIYRTELAEVMIGDIQLYGVRANINPHFHGDEVLLGMSFLKNLDFSQRDKELTLRQR